MWIKQTHKQTNSSENLTPRLHFTADTWSIATGTVKGCHRSFTLSRMRQCVLWRQKEYSVSLIRCYVIFAAWLPSLLIPGSDGRLEVLERVGASVPGRRLPAGMFRPWLRQRRWRSGQQEQYSAPETCQSPVQLPWELSVGRPPTHIADSGNVCQTLLFIPGETHWTTFYFVHFISPR